MQRSRGERLRRTLLLLLCILLPACPSDPDEVGCAEVLVLIAHSETVGLFANVVHHRCWALASSSHAVYLNGLHPTSRKDEAWGEKVYALRGSTSLMVRWSRGQLVIKAPAAGSKVLFRRDAWDGISIVYQWDGEDATTDRESPLDLRPPTGSPARAARSDPHRPGLSADG